MSRPSSPWPSRSCPPIPAGAGEGFPDGFKTYIDGIKAQLEEAKADSFTPSIDVLDGIVRTISVTPQ